MTEDEFYAKIREMIDAELRAMDKVAARRFVGWPDNIAEIKTFYEAGKIVEAQRLILAHLQKELGD